MGPKNPIRAIFQVLIYEVWPWKHRLYRSLNRINLNVVGNCWKWEIAIVWNGKLLLNVKFRQHILMSKLRAGPMDVIWHPSAHLFMPRADQQGVQVAPFWGCDSGCYVAKESVAAQRQSGGPIDHQILEFRGAHSVEQHEREWGIWEESVEVLEFRTIEGLSERMWLEFLCSNGYPISFVVLHICMIILFLLLFASSWVFKCFKRSVPIR